MKREDIDRVDKVFESFDKKSPIYIRELSVFVIVINLAKKPKDNVFYVVE